MYFLSAPENRLIRLQKVTNSLTDLFVSVFHSRGDNTAAVTPFGLQMTVMRGPVELQECKTTN